MQLLSTYEWVLTLMCMYPPHESSSMRKKAFYMLLTLAMFSVNLLIVTALLVYVWKYATTDLTGSLFTLIGIALVGQTLYSMPIAYCLRYRAQKIFVQLATIYDTSMLISLSKFSLNFILLTFLDKNADCIEYLDKMNSLSDRILPFVCKVFGTTSLSNLSLSTVSAIYCWSKYGRIKSDHVFHSFKEMCVIL